MNMISFFIVLIVLVGISIIFVHIDSDQSVMMIMIATTQHNLEAGGCGCNRSAASFFAQHLLYKPVSFSSDFFTQFQIACAVEINNAILDRLFCLCINA